MLLTEARLRERKPLVEPGGALEPLYVSLAAELEPVLQRQLFIPESTALLSRAGGRCPTDATALDFDPFSPHRHTCPRCGASVEGELHHRAWITWYQLWLAERALHAALFAVLRDDARCARLAGEVLGGYVERYLRCPNVDNVLGPSRLFFSTYLESIWLLNICVATRLLESAGNRAVADRVRDRVVQPSRALIAEFNEGRSNRQVWNNAALLAAAELCDDQESWNDRIEGSSGLLSHLADALLEDGTWYEGENYHQFALRGLWYGVALGEKRGLRLPEALAGRFERAFLAPYLTALPDFTMPSRKDSQYAVSLRQWRLAELAEIGFARTKHPLLAQSLARTYEPGHPRRDTGRARSAADVERNVPAGGLTRTDLGWRALLFAAPRLPVAPEVAQRSAHLASQGVAVFRRDPEVYVGFDYGQSGGGHGHPDRLNLTLYEGSTRWLDDMGTGSYVDTSLHWYRSTLAHNAPLAGGHSQPTGDGQLLAYDEREGMGWASARFADRRPGVVFERSVIVAPDYLVDELSAAGVPGCRVELPLHLDAQLPDLEFAPATLDGGDGLEDGFGFVNDVRSAPLQAGSVGQATARRDGHLFRGWICATRGGELFTASGPGQPAASPRRFLVLRSTIGPEGPLVARSVLSWNPEIEVSVAAGAITVTYPHGERHVHERSPTGWRVDLFSGGARSSIDLGGAVPPPPHSEPPDAGEFPVVHLPAGAAITFELGEQHYRRSELSWDLAGRPGATVTMEARDDLLRVVVNIRAGDRIFAAADAANPWDNEHPDTMAAGLQLYLRAREGQGGWMLVPALEPGVRLRELAGTRGLVQPTASWRATGGGYEVSMSMVLPASVLAGEPLDVDLLVNETVAGRVRRRGQLVLTGARGEWVYLRGDRHDDSRWLRLVIR